jgi:molybdopterin converting factor small subunit
MVVYIQFHGVQRSLTGTHEIQMTFLKHCLVRDLLEQIKACYPNLAINEDDFLVTVNNNVSTINHTLEPNDKIAFLPHIGGG